MRIAAFITSLAAFAGLMASLTPDQWIAKVLAFIFGLSILAYGVLVGLEQ